MSVEYKNKHNSSWEPFYRLNEKINPVFVKENGIVWFILPVPGFNDKNLHIEICNGTLFVQQTNNGDVIWNRNMSFEYNINEFVSYDYDINKVKATIKNGVLIIFFPKEKDKKTKRKVINIDYY